MNLYEKEIKLYFHKGYCFVIEDYMDEPTCISNHVLLALAVHLVDLQRKVLSNLNYLLINNRSKLDDLKVQ